MPYSDANVRHPTERCPQDWQRSFDRGRHRGSPLCDLDGRSALTAPGMATLRLSAASLATRSPRDLERPVPLTAEEIRESHARVRERLVAALRAAEATAAFPSEQAPAGPQCPPNAASEALSGLSGRLRPWA